MLGDLPSGKGGFPVVWQKLRDAIDGMSGNTGKHVFEPGEGLDTCALARSREASQDGRCFAAPVTAEEHPVVAAMEIFP